MIDWFMSVSPVWQALLATLFTWFLTALGASLVFFFRSIDKRVLDGMLGFAAGVMMAASYWSLLAPAIEMAAQLQQIVWIPAVVGFLLGGAFLALTDKLLHQIEIQVPLEAIAHGATRKSWKKSMLLVIAITLHNIPEGLAIGVAFGALANNLTTASLSGAVALAIGIGIQNFPEGVAVSVPLRREGLSRRKSFWYGQLSGIVEPIAGMTGAVAVMMVQPLLPYALSFAAGAMIYVVVKELIPESQMEERNQNIATLGAMVGFAIMMCLDVAL